MPAGNRTGPAGMGPMTGRGAGNCTGMDAPGYMNAGAYGRGGGFGHGGRGGGRGSGRGFGFGARQGWNQDAVPYMAAPAGVGPTPEQELAALKQQSQYLAETLKNIEMRMAELDKPEK